MKLRVYAMCGVAFSGKSTLARQIAETLSLELISLDAINHERGLHGGEGLSVSQWEATSAIAMERLRRYLDAGRSVVIDDTFSHRFLRDRCKAVAHQYEAMFTLVFVDTPLEVIRSRRLRNDQVITRDSIRDDVFDAHYASFQFPAEDEAAVNVGLEFNVVDWLKAQTETA